MVSRTGASARAAVFVALAISLTACTDTTATERTPTPSATPTVAQQESAPEESFVDFDSFVDEYKAAADSLAGSLPEGHELMARPVGEWDTDGQFEPGAGEMQAAFAWQCSWMEEYVNAVESNDRSAQQNALDRLAEWTTLPEVSPHTDNASKQVWADQVIKPARDGDDTSLLEFASGCGL